MVARWELNEIRPELGLFDSEKEYNERAWKKFKKDFHISNASSRALFDWGPPDAFYANALQTQFRNCKCEDLSPFAKEFFRSFMARRHPPDIY